MTILVVSDPLAAVLLAHKRTRGWTYREAAEALITSEPNVHRWATGKAIPERSWAPALARFLDVSEQEILDALNESARQRDAAHTLQVQIGLMRRDVQRLNEELAIQRDDALDLRDQVRKLNAQIAELTDVLSRLPGGS